MNNIWLIIGFFIISLSFIAFTPYLIRKTDNFGVSIPASLYNRSDFQTMRKQYAVAMITILLLLATFLGIVHFIVSMKTLYIFFIGFVFLYIMISFLVYLFFHRKMKKIKQTEDWPSTKKQKTVIDTSFHQEKLVISKRWYLLPTILIGVTLLLTYVMYDQMPEQIPTHTDFAGNVTYDDKSIGTVLFLPGIQIVMLGLFLFIHYLIKVAKQQVNVENPEVSKKQNVLFRRRWSVFMVATGTLMVLLFLFLQLTYIYPNLIMYEDIVIISFVAIILIGTIVLSITTGQGGSRIKLDVPADDSVMDRDEDEYWKLGQFYFNKNDPSIFIEKRFGVGWTNNWAHPISWILLLGIFGLALTPLLLIILL